MKGCNGTISSIYTGSSLDGPGIRCVVFMAGCNFRCPFCHNPETFSGQGESFTPQKLHTFLIRYKNYIKNGGITFSGGEPFLQAEFCAETIKLLKKDGIHTAVETNGSVFDIRLIGAADLFILDIKNYGGKIINNAENFLNACQKLNKPVNVTNVIIKGINDGVDSLREVKRLALSSPAVTGVEFLPFKKLCAGKYNELGIPFPYADRQETEYGDIKEIKKIYENI